MKFDTFLQDNPHLTALPHIVCNECGYQMMWNMKERCWVLTEAHTDKCSHRRGSYISHNLPIEDQPPADKPEPSPDGPYPFPSGD